MLPRLAPLLMLLSAGCAELDVNGEYGEPSAALESTDAETLLASPLPLEQAEEVRTLPGEVSTSRCQPAHAVPECRVHEVTAEGLRARIVTVPDKAPMIENLQLARSDVELVGGIRVGQARDEVAARLGAARLDELEGEGVLVSGGERELHLEEALGAPSSLTLRFDAEGTLVGVEYEGYVD